MPNENSMVNINLAGDLSKPATLLIEKVSEAVGVIFQPQNIRRVAKAEADAKMIHAVANLKIQQLQQRAAMRFIQEETKKQLNIENITAKAIPQLADTANPKNIENDWVLHFFGKCKIISDEDMQKLWAKILAGEANVPGSYSKRTIEIVSLMSKKEANLFLKLCRFSWNIGAADNFCPLIFDAHDPIYNNEGINFETLIHFDNIGLLTFNGTNVYTKTGLPKKMVIAYSATIISVVFPKEKDNELDMGRVILSEAGRELMSVCNVLPKDDFIDYVKNRWSKQVIAFNVFHPAQAIADYTKAIKLKPDDEDAYVNRGLAYNDQGNFTQAIADYSKAIELKPDDAKAYYYRSLAYYVMKDYDRAWVDVHKAQGLGLPPVPTDFLENLKKDSGREK